MEVQYNIEQIKGDGGRFVRASGTFAKYYQNKKRSNNLNAIKERKSIQFKLHGNNRIVAGGGRTDKPFVKAGNRWHAMKQRKIILNNICCSKNAVDHPLVQVEEDTWVNHQYLKICTTWKKSWTDTR